MSVWNGLGDGIAAFQKINGVKPAELRMGHDYLMAVADESDNLFSPTSGRRISQAEWRAMVLKEAESGHMKIHGITVVYYPNSSAVPGRECGDPSGQVGNSPQCVIGLSRGDGQDGQKPNPVTFSGRGSAQGRRKAKGSIRHD